MKQLKQILTIFLIVNLSVFLIGINVHYHICQSSGKQQVSIFSYNQCSCDKQSLESVSCNNSQSQCCENQSGCCAKHKNLHRTVLQHNKHKTCCVEYSKSFKINEEFNKSFIDKYNFTSPLTFELKNILWDSYLLIDTNCDDSEQFVDTSPVGEIIKYISRFSINKTEDSYLV